jgi:hypothetical protein
MNWIEWTIVIIVGSTAYVYIAFMALCTAKRMRAAAKALGRDLPPFLKLVCIVLLITGWPADVIYNWTVGNVTFKFQTPWKLTYSSRVTWQVNHLQESSNPQDAILWEAMLNAGDPLHIKRRLQ